MPDNTQPTWAHEIINALRYPRPGGIEIHGITNLEDRREAV